MSRDIHIVFICDRKLIHYFEDYINTFHHIFHVEILLYHDPNMIHIDEGDGEKRKRLLIFLQSIPPNIYEQYAGSRYHIALLNTEQLSRTSWNKRIPHGVIHIDYSEANLLCLEKSGCGHGSRIYLPYQLHHREIRQYYQPKKSRDVCIIYPHTSERRHKVIRDLKERGVNVDIISGFGHSRDVELFQYKILINLHFSEEYKIFEELRCCRAIFHQMIVISESSLYDDLHLLRKHFISVPYECVANKVVDVLANYELYHSHLFHLFETHFLPIYEDTLIQTAHTNISSIFQ